VPATIETRLSYLVRVITGLAFVYGYIKPYHMFGAAMTLFCLFDAPKT